MSFKFFNPNPEERLVGDCTIRALCRFLDLDWDTVYVGVVFEGFLLKNMPSGNEVWGAYLERRGYIKQFIPNFCPSCYTVRDFCSDNPNGRFLLVLDQHVVTVIDGDYYDTWDSGKEIPIYYWLKGANQNG